MLKRGRLLLFILLVASIAIFSGRAAWAEEKVKQAKYIFLFIGDGMGLAQRSAAELFLAARKGLDRPEKSRLVMNTFPAQGINTTYDLTSVIPDSAAAATAIACGFKTRSGIISMDAEARVPYTTIAETAKKRGWKVGVLTTVSLDHATPAAFYAHVPFRDKMYDISMQLAASGFDYFAGGQLHEPVDKKDKTKPHALEVAKKNGYQVVIGRAGFEALRPGAGKVIAMNSLVDGQAAMYFSLDQRSGEHVPLAELLAKGIDLLDNPNGFFVMIEGGKIDWACHANDAAAAIRDVLALDDAVVQAVKFYEKHPDETLIVVTGDHETGGLALGFAGTGYSSFVDKLQHQKVSFIEFGRRLAAFKKSRPASELRFEDVLPLIKESFGLYVMPAEEKARLEGIIAKGKAQDASGEAKLAAKDAHKQLKYGLALSDLELDALRKAFARSLPGGGRAKDDHAYLLYGGYEPLTVKLTTILNNKAGIGWTSYSHTGSPVMTSALGVGAALFNGYYDNTDIYSKMMRIAGFAR